MKKFVYAAFVLALSALPALASGFRMHEFSANNTGRALAGAGVAGDDYSAIAFNPAGMTLQTSGGQVGATLVAVHANVRGQVTNGGLHSGREGNIRLYSVIPHVFAQYTLDPKWSVGLGIYTPFGLSTDYNNDWFGHTHALTSKLETLDFTPSVAYKVTNSFSVGGSVVFERLNVRLSNDLPTDIHGIPVGGGLDIREPQNWEPGYTLGMMYQPIESTRFGFSYRSKIVHHLKGSAKFMNSNGFMGSYVNGKYPARAKLTLPESFLFSVHHRLNDSIDLSATVERTMWHRFKSLDIYSPNFMGGVTNIPENWKDVWFVSAGLDYHYDENLTLRGGVAYDESPIRCPQYRTARIPDNDRYWVSLGASYQWNDNITLDAAYTHMFLKKAHTNNFASMSTITATYNMQVDIVGLQVQYHF